MEPQGNPGGFNLSLVRRDGDRGSDGPHAVSIVDDWRTFPGTELRPVLWRSQARLEGVSRLGGRVIACRGVVRRGTEEPPLASPSVHRSPFDLRGLDPVRGNRGGRVYWHGRRVFTVCGHSVGIPPDPS